MQSSDILFAVAMRLPDLLDWCGCNRARAGKPCTVQYASFNSCHTTAVRPFVNGECVSLLLLSSCNAWGRCSFLPPSGVGPQVLLDSYTTERGTAVKQPSLLSTASATTPPAAAAAARAAAQQGLLGAAAGLVPAPARPFCR